MNILLSLSRYLLHVKYAKHVEKVIEKYRITIIRTEKKMSRSYDITFNVSGEDLDAEELEKIYGILDSNWAMEEDSVLEFNDGEGFSLHGIDTLSGGLSPKDHCDNIHEEMKSVIGKSVYMEVVCTFIEQAPVEEWSFK